MANKKKRNDKRKKAAKDSFSKIDKKLLAASETILSVSIESGKKWQKFIKKTVTTVEPIREKQIDMFFDTTDAVVTQVEEGAGRFKNMLGIQEDIGEMVKKQLDRKKIVKLLKSNASKLVSIANSDGIKKTIEAGAVKLKMEVEERLISKKSKAGKKAKKKKSGKKKAAKAAKSSKVKSKAKPKVVKTIKAKAKRTTAKKAPAKPRTVKKVVAKKPATKTTARKPRKTTTTKTTTARKPARKPVSKAALKAKIGNVTRAAKPRTAAVKRASTSKKDDLTLIYGIGPKMKGILTKQGITTYAALSKMPKTKLQKIINDSGIAYKAYKANQWTQQATFASKGQFSQMSKWIDKNMK